MRTRLTVDEAKICAGFAREYPCGHGYSFFSNDIVKTAAVAAEVLEKRPENQAFG